VGASRRSRVERPTAEDGALLRGAAVEILDLERAPEPFLDAMLSDLGNPFELELDVLRKRRLVARLVDMYRKRGTAAGSDTSKDAAPPPATAMITDILRRVRNESQRGRSTPPSSPGVFRSGTQEISYWIKENVPRYAQANVDQFVPVVDDDEDSRARATRLLNLHGFPVITADNGRAAVAWLNQASQLPCAIVLDLEMPVMDGRAFLGNRAQRPAWRHVPVIVVSGADDIETKVNGLDVAAIVRKPVRSTRLVAVIETVLRAAPSVADAGGSVAANSAVGAVAAAAPMAVAGSVASDVVPDEASPEPPDPTSIPDRKPGS
jgi:CheY-like chemotaxis protein